MTLADLQTCALKEEDRRWFELALQRPLNENDKQVIAFYLHRHYSLKEIARMFLEAES